MRAEYWGDMLNETGWDLVDEDEDIKLNPFEVAAIQDFMESRINTLLDKQNLSDAEKDILEIYLKLTKYIKDPYYPPKRIEDILYRIRVQKGDKIEDIIKRNPDTPDIWNRIVDACQRANLQIDMSQGTIC